MIYKTNKKAQAKTYTIVALIVIALVLFGGIFFIATKTTGNAILTNEPLKIGVFTPLTGDGAIYGDAMKKGLDLAVEEINKQGGVLGKKIQLSYEDTHLDSKEAVSAITKFIEIDKFQFVIAAEGSGAVLSAVPIADRTKTLVMIPVATNPSLKDAGDYVFRVIPSDAYQGRKIADIANSLSKKNIGIIYVNDAYGVGVKDYFKKYFNGKITEAPFGLEDKDYGTALIKIKSQNPDAIIVIARADSPLILKKIKELDINTQIIASAEFKDESLIRAAGESAEGVLLPFYAETTDYANYKDKFKLKYNSESALFSDYAYDCLNILAKAIETADSLSTEKIKNELYKTKLYGATGIVAFDENGERTDSQFVVYQIRDGKIASYS